MNSLDIIKFDGSNSRYNMKFLKNLLYSTIIVASAVLPGKLSAQIHPSNYNPFKTPNITNTERGAYGSGDVDQDGDIDWDDYNAMNSMQNDWSDVDGNGIPSTSKDKQELSEYLNGTRPYLRGHWNRLQTKDERRAWADSLLANDGISLDELWGLMPEEVPCWGCVGYSIATQIKYFGWIKADTNHNDIPPLYGPPLNSIAENGRFNIPVFRASTYGHAFNAVLIGDNPLDFNDWQFIEPHGNKMNDLKFRGENWNPPNGSYIEIVNTTEFWDSLEMDCGTLYPSSGEEIVKFVLNEDTGEPEVTYQNPNLVLTRPSVAIEDNENTNISDNYMLNQNYPNPFNSNTTISYSLPQEKDVKINIYNLKGQKLETLVNEKQYEGEQSIKWDAEKYPAGVYLYQLQTPNSTLTKKMIYLK